jgi:hypothetical protein
LGEKLAAKGVVDLPQHQNAKKSEPDDKGSLVIQLKGFFGGDARSNRRRL